MSHDENTMSLVTTISDALEDLGLCVTSMLRESEEWYDSILRTFADDESDSASLDIIWRLLQMILEEDSAMKLARPSGVATWDDVGRACTELGCPFVPLETDADLRRKLELTLFLASEVQGRRLLHLQKNQCDVPSKDAKQSACSQDSQSAAFLDLLRQFSSPGGNLSDQELDSILLEVCPNLTSEQKEKICLCNQHLVSDYGIRTKLLRQKFEATTTAFAWRKGNDTARKESGADNDEFEAKIRAIASSVQSLNVASESSTGRGTEPPKRDALQLFVQPSTMLGPSEARVIKGEVRTYDRGGRISEDDRNAMPSWENSRRQGLSGASQKPGPGGRKKGRGGGGGAKTKNKEQIKNKAKKASVKIAKCYDGEQEQEEGNSHSRMANKKAKSKKEELPDTRYTSEQIEGKKESSQPKGESRKEQRFGKSTRRPKKKTEGAGKC